MDPEEDLDIEGADEFDLEQDQEEDLEQDEGLDGAQDEEDDPESGDDPPPPRRESRGESRQARLARENRELRDRQDQLQRDIDALRQPRRPQGETPEQLQARLAALDPVERVAEIQRLSTQNTTAMIQQLQFQIADTNDQTAFNGLLSRNPQLSKHADEVEKRLKQYRDQGMNIPRTDVLKHILGEKAMESATRSRTRASRQAEARRDAQRARPGSARSDGGRETRGEQNARSARDKRLESMKI